MNRMLPLLVFAMTVGRASAQDDTGIVAFERLNSAVRQAQSFVAGQPESQPSLKLDLADISRSATRLSNLYKSSLRKKQPPNSLPRVYVISLDADSSSLESLPDTPKDSRAAIVKDVREDAGTKADYASAGRGDTFPAVIQVTVETEHEGKKVDDLWVRCNPARDGVTKTPMYLFNSATSPTTSQLPPASLIMWIEPTSGGPILAEQFIKTGQGGNDKETIKFPIP